MKKMFMITAVVICLITALSVFAACGENEDKGMDKQIKQHWMSYLKDEAVLSEVVMPGAHDAGTQGANEAWETQKGDIGEQLNAGVRYFDVRVSYSTQAKANMFVHADSDALTLTPAFGVMFSDGLADIKQFIAENSEEVIILDFQHTWAKYEEGVIAQLEKEFDMSKVLTKEDCDNPSELTMGDMRRLGKNVIIIYKEGKNGLCDKKNYLFERSVFLQSDYDGSIHKKSADDLIAHFDTYYEAKKEGVFFVLQSQLTGSPLMEREKSIRDKANAFVRSLAKEENAQTLAKTNIVMRDFITSDIEGAESSDTTVKSIVILNQAKGLIKEGKLEMFRKSTGYDSLLAM